MEEGVTHLFVADSSGRTMTGENYGVIRQREQLSAYRFDQLMSIPLGKVGAAYAVLKNSVAGEDESGFRHIEAYPSARMSGSLNHADFLASKV